MTTMTTFVHKAGASHKDWQFKTNKSIYKKNHQYELTK